MGKTNFQLPYFDALLEHFREGNAEIVQAFGRHVHWGYWENPSSSDGSVADFAIAAEALCRRVCDAGGVRDGLAILDCGCGFGGTVASLNERFSNVKLVGLNIDPRQLDRAREQVQPRKDNNIEFIEGDACELPFEDASFDVVLAVECIFHFPSRKQFFQEARRVLKPGGKLAICDFVPQQWSVLFLKLADIFVKPVVTRTYGYVEGNFSLLNYRNLAKNTGFVPILSEDITLNTLPTYPVLLRLIRQGEAAEEETINRLGGWVSRLGLIRYMILSFEAL
ncbi:methyltransferase domain-containing protein [Microcoleus sp. FACHB-831]|uniref:class I SAM-dependent methyltransferase n=1 Tax=Microcoleus sp. FACHB-831 TaxID=2692827 RepID=UPI001682982E|nr:class I SAM-dependent methyltransferase [Microcoleus sp. FACHB-831]MBD1920659.1 methyltransferase domain-containing protein [Microcoleus sp. FACHB-831]